MRRGVVLFELLVGALIALLLGTVLLRVFTTAYMARSVITGQNVANTESRKPLDALADHIRNAWLYYNGTEYKVFAPGCTATDLTYYINDNGDSIRYYLSGTNLRRVVSGSDTIVATNVTNLRFTYYKSADYNSAPVETINSTAPSNAELPLLSAVHITATMSIDGFQSYYDTLVRLRNSPRKARV